MNSEFSFGPTWFPGMFTPAGRLGAFCKGNSSTQSNPDSSTKINDSRTTADGTGTIAAGSGASVTINSTDAEVVGKTSDAVAKMAETAVEAGKDAALGAADTVKQVAKDAIASQESVAKVGMSTVAGTARDALDFGGDALTFAAKVQESANAVVEHNNTAFAENLARNAGDAPQTVAQDALKTMAVVAGAAVVGGIILVVLSRKTSA